MILSVALLLVPP
jgi:hypothetical protein